MFFLKKNKSEKGDNVILTEFKRLWNEELSKNVDSRDFSKAYNYALRKYAIRDMCMKTYFDFESEDSLRFKEACKAFDDGDIFWTFMLIRQFASLPGYSSKLKNLTNKRRTFLSEKRKETVITRNSARMFLHNLMQFLNLLTILVLLIKWQKFIIIQTLFLMTMKMLFCGLNQQIIQLS